MKWYSIKKYKPDYNEMYMVRAISENYPIYFTARFLSTNEWSLAEMESICIHDGPNNCIDVVGNDSYEITHFCKPDPIEIE